MEPLPELAAARRAFVTPPELDRSLPREVRLTPAGRALLAVAVVLLAAGPVVGAVLFRQAGREDVARQAFTERSAETEAEVV